MRTPLRGNELVSGATDSSSPGRDASSIELNAGSKTGSIQYSLLGRHHLITQLTLVLLFFAVQGLEAWRLLPEGKSSFIAVGLCSCIVFSTALERKRRRIALQTAGRLTCPGAVDRLLDLMVYANTGARFVRSWRPFLLELARLLPYLTDAEIKLLSPDRVAVLTRSLNSRSPDFAVSALPIIGKCGGPEALPLLEAIAAGNGAGTKRTDVQIAARQSLKNIVMRRTERNDHAMLLRTNVTLGDDQSHLLRESSPLAISELSDLT